MSGKGKFRTVKLKEAFRDWLATRPEIIRKMGDELPPWYVYRIRTTEQICSLYSYSEDGTVTVNLAEPYEAEGASGEMAMINQVFGLKSSDLVKMWGNSVREKSEASDPRLGIGTNYCKCSACGQYFGSHSSFDFHRKGEMSDRRCLTPEDMRESGYAQDEMSRWRRPMSAKRVSALRAARRQAKVG